MSASSDRLFDVWETNYGRDCGWIVEKDGKIVAMLDNNKPVEMFWNEYDIIAVCDEGNDGEYVFTREFWDSFSSETLRFRNCEFQDEVSAFPAGNPVPHHGKVVMRGLYIPVRAPDILNQIAIYFRRIFGRQFTGVGPWQKIGGRNRVDRSELEKLLSK